MDLPFVIGQGKKDKVSAAQYISQDKANPDVIGLQITTAGVVSEEHLEKFKSHGDQEATLYLQGLSDRVAEDLADIVTEKMRTDLGFPEQARIGLRYSPGYPGIPNILYNDKIIEILNAHELIGVTTTEAGQLAPTCTTAAITIFHPDASYS
jgi:5-methyltetrahydrofolate--homocysteine methyltransferase